MEFCQTNTTVAEYAHNMYSQASWSFVVIFVPLVAVFGIASNCSFMFVVYRIQAMRNVTNIYLVNLAIADCSLLIAAFIQYIGDYINSPVYDLHFSFHTAFGCSIPNFLIYLSYNSSLWTITLVSFERYLATCHIFWHRLVSNRSRAIRMVLLIWIFSLLFAGLAAPYSPGYVCIYESKDYDSIYKRVVYCNFVCEWCEGALYMLDCIQYTMALCLNIIMYSLIINKLSKSKRLTEENGMVRDNIVRAIHTRNAVAKMLIINGVVFFICLTPFSIANIEGIFYYFGDTLFSDDFIDHLGWAGRVLFLLNSALNPLVYNLSNSRYRQAFKEVFCFRTTKQLIYKTVSLRTTTSHISNCTKI